MSRSSIGLAFAAVIFFAWTAMPAAQTPEAPQVPQTPETPTAAAAEGTANPKLVGALATALGATPRQAEGAAGSILNLAKSRLQPADWSKVAGAVPGIEGLLKAAPAVAEGGGGGAAGALGGGKLGGLASLAGSFKQLGLPPGLVAKAVPIVTQHVLQSGGAGVGKLLADVLK